MFVLKCGVKLNYLNTRLYIWEAMGGGGGGVTGKLKCQSEGESVDNKKYLLDKTIIIIQFKQRLGIHTYLTKSIVHIL